MSWWWCQAWVTHRPSWSPSSSTPWSASWGARERSRLAARVLFFDLDGTLTDSRLGITRYLKHALEQLGRPSPPDDVLASFIGPSLRQAFATLLETSNTELIGQAVTLYRERLSAKGLYENALYQGIPEMLERAGQVAAAAFVVTSKLTVFARRIVEHFGLDGRFTQVYGSQLDGRFDDKAELIAHVLESEKIDPDAAVMIGDRAVDIQGARANSIRSIGVLWGYGSEQELVEAGADRLCVTPAALENCW